MVVVRLTTTNDGYAAIQTHGSRPVYVHRLVAYAHGEIDGLEDDRHVHHRDGCTWVNSPENLEACEHDRHGRHHLHGESLSV